MAPQMSGGEFSCFFKSLRAVFRVQPVSRFFQGTFLGRSGSKRAFRFFAAAVSDAHAASPGVGGNDVSDGFWVAAGH